MLSILLLTLGIGSRLIVHMPNFTPVMALALFSGVYVKRKYALITPLALMMVSDVIIGFHNTLLFTWGSVALIAAVGLWVRKNKGFKTILGSSLFSALLFFIITNFGAWLMMYPHTWEGILNCYTVAIPYFRNTVLSTLIFSFIFFGLYEIIASQVRNTRFARVLLTT